MTTDEKQIEGNLMDGGAEELSFIKEAMHNKSLNQKLYFVQNAIKSPKAEHNKFGNYNYRTCDGILEAFKSVVPAGCFINLSDEIVFCGDRFYIKSTATFSDGENSLFATALAREPDNKKGQDVAQTTGTSTSYARKMALSGLLALDNNKDLDSYAKNEEAKEARDNAIKPWEPKEAEAIKENAVLSPDMMPIGVEKARELSGLIVEAGSDFDVVVSHAKRRSDFDGLADMPLCVFLQLQTKLTNKIAADAKKAAR